MNEWPFFSTETIVPLLIKALGGIAHLTPATLKTAFQSAKEKYGNIITRRKLNKRIPIKINQDNVLEVFLGLTAIMKKTMKIQRSLLYTHYKSVLGKIFKFKIN